MSGEKDRVRLYRHPEIVDTELGTREYWFEEYRRVVVARASSNCFFVSIDLYAARDKCSGEAGIVLEDNGTELIYSNLDPSSYGLDGVEPSAAWLVYLSTRAGCEVIGFQAVYCTREPPGRESLWSLYRRLVVMVEGRDPEREPLKPREAPLEMLLARIGLGREAADSE